MLTSSAFLAALALLLLNDVWLKAAYGGWWTGKLSDFTGLYVFPVLLTALQPRARRWVFPATALGFLLWKSPLSTPVLQAWNQLGLWPLTRVVDYTDWIALLALPVGYRHTAPATPPGSHSGWWHRLAATVSGCVAVVAILGTSRAVPTFAMGPSTGYYIRGSRPRVVADLLANHVYRESGRNDSVSVAGADTVSYTLTRPIGENDWVHVRLELRDAGCGTILTPLDFSTRRKHPDIGAITDSLNAVLIQPLQTRFADCPVDRPQ